MEEKLILDNPFTEHSTGSLAHQWENLNQLGMRIKQSLMQQIQARNQSGVSEDALNDFSVMSQECHIKSGCVKRHIMEDESRCDYFD